MSTNKPPKRADRPVILETSTGVNHPGVHWGAAIERAALTQAEVARRMGVAPMTLSRLVNGHGIPTARVAVAYARAMKVSVAKTWQQVCDYELALALDAERASEESDNDR